MQPTNITQGRPATQPAHSQKAGALRDRLIRLNEVEALTACKKSTLYMMMSKNQFVRPVRLSARHVAWSENAVLSWVQDRIAGGGQSRAKEDGAAAGVAK